MSDVFGTLTSPYQIEAAALQTLRKWLPSYLGEVAAQTVSTYGTGALAQNTIPAPADYWGAADIEKYEGVAMPLVIVVCGDPKGEPERTQSQGYVQAYDLVTAIIINNDDEDTARQHASLYSAALMGVVLNKLAVDWPALVNGVWLTGAPMTELQDPDNRLTYTGQCSFDVYVQLTGPGNGPGTPGDGVTGTGPAEPVTPGQPTAPGEPVPVWPEVTTVTGQPTVTTTVPDE